jgi:hypothetical protein
MQNQYPQEILAVAYQSPELQACLTAFELGRISYVQALERAVCALHRAAKRQTEEHLRRRRVEFRFDEHSLSTEAELDRLGVTRAPDVPRKESAMQVTVGDRVQDRITGLTGIAMGRTHWITGCHTVGIQREELDKDGNVREPVWVDEARLVVVVHNAMGVDAHARAQAPTGGPTPTPQRQVAGC